MAYRMVLLRLHDTNASLANIAFSPFTKLNCIPLFTIIDWISEVFKIIYYSNQVMLLCMIDFKEPFYMFWTLRASKTNLCLLAARNVA